MVDDRGSVFQVLVTELCALNPDLMDYINNLTTNAAKPSCPAPEKVNVALLPTLNLYTVLNFYLG